MMRKYTPFSSVETSIVAAFSALKSYSPTVLPDMSTNLTVPIAFPKRAGVRLFPRARPDIPRFRGEEVAGDEDFPLQQGALLADGGGVVEGGRPRRRILRVLRTAKGKHASAEGDNQSGKEIVQQNIQANEIDKNMTCGQCHTGNGCFFRRGRLLFTI